MIYGDNSCPGGAVHPLQEWHLGAAPRRFLLFILIIVAALILAGCSNGTTEPLDEVVIPWMNLQVPTFQLIRDMRLQLTLTPTGAAGLIAGYADVDTWYKQLIRNDSTHHLSNGQISGISLYKALRRLADAHPDPETGANTAISTALDVKLTQVFIVHPQGAAARAVATTH